MKSKQIRDGSPRKAKSKGRHVSLGVLLAIAVLAVAVFGTFAMSRNSSQASPKKYKATKEIVLDKASGKIRKPTVEETDAMVAQISELTNRSSEGLTVQDYANGAKGMNLEGRFNGVVVGRANADGTTEVRCVFTIEEAAEFLGLEQE